MVTIRSKKENRKHLQIAFLLVFIFGLFFNTFSFSASASGIIETPENNGLSYTAYPFERYVLDYGDVGFLDAGGIINAICNGLFFICNCLGNFTGWVVKEAYSMDLIKNLSNEIGNIIRNIAGINGSNIPGVSGYSIGSGLISGFLLLIIVCLGVYVAYQGLAKRATSKAVSALTNFLVIFISGICLVAYSPTLINNIADFSSEVNTSMLSVTSFIFFNGEEVTSSVDETDLIYNNVWNVTVYQPWKLMQFGDVDVDQERIDGLLTYKADSDERVLAVQADINTYDNEHFKSVGSKLGTVFLVLIVDIVICIFVLMLAGMLVITQFMFLIFACILPFVLIFSMIPGFSGKLGKYAVYMFNLLLSKIGITLVMTLAFGVSSLLLSISKNSWYLLTAFLQVCCFVAVWVFMPKILAFIGIDQEFKQVTNSFISPFKRNSHKAKRGLRQIGHSAAAYVGLNNLLNKRRSNKSGKHTLSDDTVEKSSEPQSTKQNAFVSNSNGKFANRQEKRQSVNDKSYDNTDSSLKNASENTNASVADKKFSNRQEKRKVSLGGKVGSAAAKAAFAVPAARQKIKRTGQRIKNAPANIKYGILTNVSDVGSEFKKTAEDKMNSEYSKTQQQSDLYLQRKSALNKHKGVRNNNGDLKYSDNVKSDSNVNPAQSSVVSSKKMPSDNPYNKEIILNGKPLKHVDNVERFSARKIKIGRNGKMR